jgi:hypothetical protein
LAVQQEEIQPLKEKIEALQGEPDAITGEVAVSSPAEAPTPTRRKYHMSAADKRKLIKALARARKYARPN